MLISMPTATSTIFGAFQAMIVLPLALQAILHRVKSNRCTMVRNCFVITM
jgi:hypothetical protein